MLKTNISQQTLMRNKNIIFSENKYSGFFAFLFSAIFYELGKSIRDLFDNKLPTKKFFSTIKSEVFHLFLQEVKSL